MGERGGVPYTLVEPQFVLIVFCLFVIFIYFCRFGFESGICLLIAPVPVHCFSIIFFSSHIFHLLFCRLSGSGQNRISFSNALSISSISNLHKISISLTDYIQRVLDKYFRPIRSTYFSIQNLSQKLSMLL